MDLRKNILTWYGVVVVFFYLLALGIVVKVLAIQFVGANKWEGKLKILEERTRIVEGNRGDICATDGRILATSIPYYEIRFDLGAPSVRKVFHQKLDELSAKLSTVFTDKSPAQFRRELVAGYNRKARYYLVHPRKVNHEELQRLRTFPIFEGGKYRGGFMPEAELTRVNPHGKMAFRTIGLLNKGEYGGLHGSVGLTGIEAKYEKYLKGDEGVILQQNLSGRWVNITTNEPDAGADVITTIDIYMQDVVENALRKQLVRSNAHHGTAVLMEVETGKIRAIANLGRSGDGYGEIYNYAMGHEGCTEPGSTFKLVSLIVAMDAGLVDTSDIVDIEEGKWQHYEQTIYDSDYGENHDREVSVKEIFERSSNVGMAKIITSAYKGREREFIDRIYNMGLNKPLGMGFKGEATPYIKYPNDPDWWGTSLAWMSYGYESKLSPLQILTFYNAVANDGKMVKPMVVEAIRKDGRTIESFDTEVLKSAICSRETVKKAQDLLKAVVESGTAKQLQPKHFKIAGKTGTAQIAEGNKGYVNKKYQASFAGYFPADNPKYSCIVVVNQPQGYNYYGGTVSGPVFKEIAEGVVGYDRSLKMKVAPTNSEEEINPPLTSGIAGQTRKIYKELGMRVRVPSKNPDWIQVKRNEDKIEIVPGTVERGLVPNLRGMGVTDAVYLVEKSGLRTSIQGVGKVVRQSPAAGSRLKPGQTVVLVLG